MDSQVKQRIYLNGKSIRSWNTFVIELKEALCLSDTLNLKNPDVVNDVLSGGYGNLAVNEAFILHWQAFGTSKRRTPAREFQQILNALLLHGNITLERT